MAPILIWGPQQFLSPPKVPAHLQVRSHHLVFSDLGVCFIFIARTNSRQDDSQCSLQCLAYCCLSNTFLLNIKLWHKNIFFNYL